MRFLKANTLFNGKENLPDNAVLVIDNDNYLKEITSENKVEKSNIEYFEGILTPGFVNAHCHLELSHLKNVVPQHTGLPQFAKQIITQRNKFSSEYITEKIQSGDEEMWRNGVVAVGDISNGSDSFLQKKQSKIFYHTFIELIGLNPVNSTLIFNKGLELLKTLVDQGLKGSLAPHAPYSTSTELIEKISTYDSEFNLPFTIHNQESEEETKFFKGEPSGFNDLYKFLGLDTPWFKAPGKSSLQTYAPFLSETISSILVHNTFTSQEDLKSASKKKIVWCFCPGANLYIENRLPDFTVFAGCENKICIGTDSLASNSQLDIIKEVNHILNHSKMFSSQALLRAITFNGAEALGISDQFGSFIPGKNTGLNLVDFQNSQFRFLKKII